MGVIDMEVIDMEVIAVSSALVGAWANRWNVFILVPLIAAALVTAALYGIANGDGAGGIALDMVAAVASLQAGYVGRWLLPPLWSGRHDALRLGATASRR